MEKKEPTVKILEKEFPQYSEEELASLLELLSNEKEEGDLKELKKLLGE